MPIHILSDQLASQIAAGEVVERPSSVIKELVENALDAAATAIFVDVTTGGRQAIQVSDNGSGIPAADIETAFLRHATSKLTSAADLNTIRTLGFRGEALAAIAAVSQVTMVSRVADEVSGTRLVLHGGRIVSRETMGAPQGTVIAVENLFYNVPARLKFLKSITTEKRLIDEFITRYALAYPQVRFRLSHDGRISFQSTGNDQPRDILAALYGPTTARQLLAIESENEAAHPTPTPAGDVTVSGFVAPAGMHWGNRSHITLFVNGRWVKDNSLTYAVIQAYHTLLPTGRYPLGIIFLTLPPEAVDVNVHPAKTEVRFRQGDHIFGAVQRAVRQTLLADTPVRSMTDWSPPPQAENSAEWGGKTAVFSRRDPIESLQPGLGLDWAWSADDLPTHTPPTAVPLPTPHSEPSPPPRSAPAQPLGGDRLPIMRVVGQIGAAYIITEGPEGMYLIDQHAAHERILYEQFLADWQQQRVTSQGLMAGTAVHLPPSQTTLLTAYLETLADLGFQVEPFGPNAFMVRAIPAILTRLDPAQALLAVVEDLERGDVPLQGKIEARIILRVCKTAAVKAGQTLSLPEMEAMIRQLEACHNPHTCPHGRPTLIHLSVAQLARQFGRI